MTNETKAQEIIAKYEKKIDAIDEAINDLHSVRMHDVDTAYPEGKKITVRKGGKPVEVVCTGLSIIGNYAEGGYIDVRNPKTDKVYSVGIRFILTDSWKQTDPTQAV